VPLQVRSVPLANGTALFEGLAWNDHDDADVVTIDPGSSFGDWPVEIQAADDPEWRVPPVAIVVEAGDTVDFRVRVATGWEREVRSGRIRIDSQIDRLEHEIDLRLFNGTWSLLVVDDDFGLPDEDALLAGLEAGGLPQDVWEVRGNPEAISADVLRTYDLVLWQTGHRVPRDPPALTLEDFAALRDYVDGGGGLLLSSQHVLDHADLEPGFTTEYLGVASQILDLGYMKMLGAPQDPIGSGMDLDLPVAPPGNKADAAFPAATARAFLVSPEGYPAALRNELASGARVVLLPWALHALASEQDPDNIATLARRSFEWILRFAPSEAPEGEAEEEATGIVRLRPNPARGPVEIEIRLSGRHAERPARLEVFDLAGRRVARLWDAPLGAGSRVFTWSAEAGGRDRSGTGVYFVRLRTADRTESRKVVVLP
jgi:hypothetical protein